MAVLHTKITINGHELTMGQSMTVRVALESFYLSLQENALGDDKKGKQITVAYMESIKQIRSKIL